MGMRATASAGMVLHFPPVEPWWEQDKRCVLLALVGWQLVVDSGTARMEPQKRGSGGREAQRKQSQDQLVLCLADWRPPKQASAKEVREVMA